MDVVYYGSSMLPDSDTCLIKKNTTLIISVYEGIPETFLLNIISWSVLLILFTVLRNRAWDYGRLALVQSEKLMHLFYGNNTNNDVATDELTDSLTYRDQGCCCSWIPAIFTISKDRFFTRCGPDAVHYLVFQKYLMYLMAIEMVIALGVILPVNFQGDLQGNEYNFGHTTISNLTPTSRLLWVHIVVSFLYVPITLLIMRRCSTKIPSKQSSSRTIMITNILHAHRKPDDIHNYLTLLYPNISIQNVTIAHNISKLMIYDRQRDGAHHARLYCELHSKQNIQAYPKGYLMCCCCCASVNAFDYYTEEEIRLNETVKAHRELALAQPLGIAFVTLESATDVRLIVKHFEAGTHRAWILSEAPTPSDIFWENLNVGNKYWYLKAILVNFVLFLVLFFLTTPAVVVNTLDALYKKHDNDSDAMETDKLSPIVSEFLATLLLWTMSALLPVFVAYSDEWLSHWTRSKQNRAVMNKTFIFLLFMVLVLPSLGLTSAQALLELSLKEKNESYRWECVFLPDKGAFFVNYVITSALIGTALELIRFPELSRVLLNLCVARSKAEIVNVQRTVLSEFAYGINYAWTLLIFTITTTYSLICPLITPFGLLYMILKHIGDRHNLYFAYRPSYMGDEGKHIHNSAIKMVRVGVVFMQATLAGLAVLRGGWTGINLVIIIVFIITTGLFFIRNPFPVCIPDSSEEAVESNVNVHYVPPVLQQHHHNNMSTAQESPVFHLNYGSAYNPNQEIITTTTDADEDDDIKRF